MAVVWLVLSTILWGSWAIFEKKLTGTGNLYWVNAYYVMAEVTAAPFYIWAALKFGGQFQWNWSMAGWAYAAWGANAGATMIGLYLLSKYDAGWVTSITAAYPLVTVVLAILFLGEQISVHGLIGAVLVAAGLVLLSL